MNYLLTPNSLKKFFFTFICPTFYGGGGPSTPANTTSTVTQNTIPAELMPYATGMLSAAKGQLYTQDDAGKITGFQPYKPYSANATDYVAPFSSLQTQSQQGAAGLQTPGQFAPATGMAGMGGIQSLNAGANFANQATDPNATAAYMSPYMQNVVQQQQREANRTYDISATKEMGQATQQGAFGGSREALMAAENERNRNMTQADIQATGTQNAYKDAQQQQQYAANLGLQGAGQATNAAATLGNIGTAQLAAQQGIIGTQGAVGATQQAQNQKAIDQSVLDYQNAQQQPYTALGTMSALIHGTPMGNLSTQNYTAQPSALSQLGGALGTAGSLYGASQVGKAEGGVIEDRHKYAAGGIAGFSVGGAIEADLYDMSPEQLQEVIQTATSDTERSMAKRILAEKSMANGGIVGFSGERGSQVKDWKSQLENVSQEMTAKEYKLHGWTDDDIAEYKSSGRVPLDPKKQVALRDHPTQPEMPKAKGVYTPPRTPESEVINLPDENVTPRATSTKASTTEKGLAQLGPRAASVSGDSPLSREGEYIPREAPSTGIAEAGQPIIEGETMPMRGNLTEAEYAERVNAWKAARAGGKYRPMSAEAADWERQLGGQENPAVVEGPAKPTGAAAKTTPSKGIPAADAYTAGEVAPGELGARVKGAISNVGKGIGSVAKGLVSPANIAYAGSEYNAEKFKEGLGKDSPLTSVEKAILGAPGVLQSLIPGMAEFKAEQQDRFIKANPRISQKLGLIDAVAGAGSGATAPSKGLGSISPTAATPTAQTPPAAAIDKIDEAVGRGITRGVYREPVVSNVDERAGGEVPEGAQTTSMPEAAPEKERSLAEYQQEIRDAEGREGIKSPDDAAGEYRRSIMEEKSNAADESKRQTYLRMAEFFAHWGSTPGAPLVAGMQALTKTMPGYLEDKKDQKKLATALNKSLYDLEAATRLEKKGDLKGAYALKNQASERIMAEKKLTMEAAMKKDELAAAQKRAETMAGATVQSATIRGAGAAANPDKMRQAELRLAQADVKTALTAWEKAKPDLEKPEVTAAAKAYYEKVLARKDALLKNAPAADLTFEEKHARYNQRLKTAQLLQQAGE